MNEEDQKKDITKILRAVNPRLPSNRVYYDYKIRGYRPLVNVDHVVYHFQQFSRIEYQSENICELSSSEDSISSNESEHPISDIVEVIEEPPLPEEPLEEVFDDEIPLNLPRLKFNNQDRQWRVAHDPEGLEELPEPIDEKDGLNSQRRHAVDFTSPVQLASTSGKKGRKLSANYPEEDVDVDDLDIFDLEVTDLKEPKKRVAKLIDKSKVFERGTQTPYNDTREKGVFTESPPSDTFTTSSDQGMIYDKYVEEVIRNEIQLQHPVNGRYNQDINHNSFRSSRQNVLTQSNLKKLKPIQYGSENFDLLRSPLMILERMIYHNNGVDLLLDLSDWDDPADELRKSPFGTMLPLWKINCGLLSKKFLNLLLAPPKTLSLTVTDIKWCKSYPDLLILTIGHYEFSIETMKGFLCGFSLKNLEVPEFVIATNSGAMCLDVNTERSSLVCVGFYDGSIAVYDISKTKSRNKGLLGRSTCMQEHHIDMVTSIKWLQLPAVNLLQSQLLIPQTNDPAFVSTGEDGRVILWRKNKE